MSASRKERDALLAELTAVLSDKVEAAVKARLALRDAVCAYVAVEQARGIPLAAVVQAVKKILCAAEERVAKATDALAIQLVDWCVEFQQMCAELTEMTAYVPYTAAPGYNADFSDKARELVHGHERNLVNLISPSYQNMFLLMKQHAGWKD